jgi:hypothetical protein
VGPAAVALSVAAPAAMHSIPLHFPAILLFRRFAMGMSFIFLLLAFQYLSGVHKRLFWLKALGPLTVCVISIALMNIFDWWVRCLAFFHSPWVCVAAQVCEVHACVKE